VIAPSYSSGMEAKLVPATPSVIAWAIRESGYSLGAVAALSHLSEHEIDGWIRGNRPELAKLQAFAEAVERPFAAFLLPQPPSSPGPAVEFRSASSANRRDLNPEERRHIREAARLQEIVSWLTREMNLPAPELPASSTKAKPEDIAATIRARLNVSLDVQLSWSSSGEALRAWREAVEALGVTVLMVSMGEESCRGFCIWDDAAPLIAINTAWLPEARVFTLLHELAHLVTRTNSACAEDAAPGSSTTGDHAERWCERVAAAVAVPAAALASVMSEMRGARSPRPVDLSTASRIATRFRVSRRAAALRLIECQAAPWSLFKSIPPHTDRQESGGGSGRTRVEIRRQRYGGRTMTLFGDALQQNVLSAADVVDYLGVSADALTTSRMQPPNSTDV
jgi:Zn-dependent peptidase ImmA (M78 family)